MKVTIRTAILQAISDRMDSDPSVLVLGEGARVKYSLDQPAILRRHPDRILTGPVAEGGMVGVALGAALDGMRPVVDITFNDLLLRTMDEVLNHVAKAHFMTGGKVRARIVIKADFNRPENAQSGNRLEFLFLRSPGLRVLVPSTPSDAYHFMRQALIGENPVIFFEDRLIGTREELNRVSTASPPLGKARILTRGSDLTVVTYACTVGFAMEAISTTDEKVVELIDLRSLNPLDIETVVSSVEKTGRLLIIEPDQIGFGVGSEIAAIVGERCFGSLKEPIRRMGGENLFIPAAVNLQGFVLPSMAKIKQAVTEMLRGTRGREVTGK